MRHMYFGDMKTPLKTAILIKGSAFNQTPLVKHYINPLYKAGISPDTIIGFTLDYGDKKKASAAVKKAYLDKLLPELDKLGITTLFVPDADYFKTFTKNSKAEPYFGYVCDCVLPGYEHLKVILGVNYQAISYNPTLQEKQDLALATLTQHLKNKYSTPGQDIIHFGGYPETVEDIAAALQSLHQYPELTIDYEAFGLKFYNAGIGTVSFAWDKHHGIAFKVDYQSIEPTEIQVWDKKDKRYKKRIAHGQQVYNAPVRQLLREFLNSYQGKLTYHNGGYDIKLAIYQLWMKDLGDYEGMVRGIEKLTASFDDTKLIAYLATNNAAQNVLTLKALAQEFAGNFAQDDITDIRLIEGETLLQYNLTDGLSTWYTKEKYYPRMVLDNQLNIYNTMFKPMVRVILELELTGMPIDPERVQQVKEELQKIAAVHITVLQKSSLIQGFHLEQLTLQAAKESAALKTKERTVEELIAKGIEFNPNSSEQVRQLIYEYLGYAQYFKDNDIDIDLTKGGQYSTKGKVIKKLVNHAQTAEHKAIFESLVGLSKVQKILSSFIPAFEEAQQLPDGSYRLYGNVNLGGTQSGRLSSSNPNLQNIPSGSTYAKLIKSCFISYYGWLFAGADYKALEAVCEALLSGDPNKLKVYIDGFDSHCVNTYAYFKELMANIDPDSVASVNSIQDKYPDLRQNSKAPTFALQYGGTWRTIQASSGLAAETCKQIEYNYHKLYEVSDAWIKGVLDQAHTDGYVTCAYGLRVRTPILAQTPIMDKYPFVAGAERRSAGNSKTQSYGMLNNMAAIKFQQRVWNSPYRGDIRLVILIHDAVYILIRDRLDVVAWANRNLVECMCEHTLTELDHDIVKLGAEMDIYWPNWAKTLTLPNNADEQEIVGLVTQHIHELKEAA